MAGGSGPRILRTQKNRISAVLLLPLVARTLSPSSTKRSRRVR